MFDLKPKKTDTILTIIILFYFIASLNTGDLTDILAYEAPHFLNIFTFKECFVQKLQMWFMIQVQGMGRT